jgi:hypothetical protein
MSHPFGLSQDLQERLAQIAIVSLVSQGAGQWLLALAATREAILSAARRMEDAGHHEVAMQTRLEALLLTAENPVGPLDKAIQQLYPVVTAVGTAERDGRPQAPEGQDRRRREASPWPATDPFDGAVLAPDVP